MGGGVCVCVVMGGGVGNVGKGLLFGDINLVGFLFLRGMKGGGIVGFRGLL